RTDSTEMLRTTVADEKSHVEIPSRVQYVKFGLSHVRSQNDWRERWQAALVALPAHVRPVAVAYADESAADAPDALDVLETGESLGCSILLVDTYAKDGRSLLEHWVPGRIAEVIAETQRRGMKIALAGSLRLAEAPRLLELRPDFLAVRGGACRGGRTGSLDAELTARWAEMVADHNARIKPIESETAAGGETWATLL
ncbi:MAG TPA: (5-formylfuran-3-yl)methyl phosphate synthase, partial [Pirellulales bacterium]